MAQIRIDADAKAAINEILAFTRAQERIVAGQDKIATKSQEVANEERRIARERDRLIRETETAQERLRRRMEDFNRSVRDTGISEEKKARARRKIHQDFLEDLAKENEGLIDFKEELEEVEETSQGAFDAGRLFQYAAGFLTVQTAVQKALEVVRGVREETDRLGENIKEISGSSGNLVQLAGADAELRDKLFAASDEVFAAGLVKSREEADKLIFELQSAGRLGELDFFKGVSAIDDAASIARSIGTISSALRGIDAVGSSADIFSKTLAAANPAVGVNAGQIAQAVAEIAGAAKAFSLRDEELFAAISVSAQQTGDASQSASNIRQLLVSAARQGLADELRGQGLGAIIRRVESQGTTDKDLVKFLGDIQGIQGFRQLQDLGRFNARLRDIELAARSGLSEQTILNALGSDRIRAAQFSRSADARGVIDQDRKALDELFADAAQARARQQAREQYGDAYAYLNDQAIGFSRYFSESQDELARLGRLQSDAAFSEERANAQSRIQGNAGAGAAEEQFYEQRRRQQARDSAAFAVLEREKEAAEEAAKQAKKDEAAKNKAEREQRRIDAAEKRAESEAARAERERTQALRDSSAFATQSRRTAELAREAGIAFEPESAIESFRAKNAAETAGRTDTEVLRLIAEKLDKQIQQNEEQSRLLKNRAGTRTR